MKRLPLTEDNYRATIEGRKTVTRRVMVPQPKGHDGGWFGRTWGDGGVVLLREPYHRNEAVGLTLPHWRSCDLVWDEVTEIWRIRPGTDAHVIPPLNECRRLPAMLMPGWACLHFARIVSVRPERLQDVTVGDVKAEGVPPGVRFAVVWDSVNAKRGYGWATDPWVWRIEYKLCEADDVGR